MKMPRLNLPLVASALSCAAVYALGAACFHHFASPGVVRNLLVDNSFLLVAAVGATVVILSGGIDLSVGAVMAMTSCLLVRLVEQESISPAWAIAMVLVIGVAFGAAQGALIVALSAPPFLVTLAGLFLARSAAFAILESSRGIEHELLIRASRDWSLPIGSVDVPAYACLALAIAGTVAAILRHTRLGVVARALGDEPEAVRRAGLGEHRARVATYAASGLLSALAGVVFVLYQGSADPAALRGFELDTIAAVVIGGTPLSGGVGSVLGTCIGVTLLGLIQTLVAFHGGLSSWWTRVAIGGLLLAFLTIQRASARDRRRR